MNLKNVKILLYIAIALLVCQEIESFQRVTNIVANVSPVQYDDHNRLRYFSISNNFVEIKIADGTYAKNGQFPFMAIVHQLLGAGRITQCGGTILSKRWVLTAGHCIANFPQRFFVVFSTINKSSIGYNFNQGPGISMIVTQAVLHPQYGQTVNDIGTIQPINLPGYAYAKQNFAGKIAYVIGWGKDQQTSTGTKNLKYATLPIISNYKCNQYWSIAERNICTAPGFGQNACQGDSGGPLAVLENGQVLQVGIVSYGDANCPSNTPGVFTRVSSFIQWIQDVTQIRY